MKDRNGGLSIISENILREGGLRYDHNNPHPMAPNSQMCKVEVDGVNISTDIKRVFPEANGRTAHSGMHSPVA